MNNCVTTIEKAALTEGESLVSITEVMALYQCHKKVMAAEIKQITIGEDGCGDTNLVIALPGTSIEMSYTPDGEVLARYMPNAGDYLVMYENGYLAISPKDVFDEGYSPLDSEASDGASLEQIEMVAKMCHEVNRAYCAALREEQLPWEEAPEWQRESAIKGVAFHLLNPEAGPEASHNAWLAEKAEQGWVYGKVKDAEKKTHHCIVPFHHLPTEQQAKDHLFKAVVKQSFHEYS